MDGRFGIMVDSSVAAGPNVAAALSNVQKDSPNAVVEEQITGSVSSAETPILDGHNVIALRLANTGDQIAAGPPRKGPQEIATPICAVAFYDANTGERLALMRLSKQLP
jgi:hypothetical protein